MTAVATCLLAAAIALLACLLFLRTRRRRGGAPTLLLSDGREKKLNRLRAHVSDDDAEGTNMPLIKKERDLPSVFEGAKYYELKGDEGGGIYACLGECRGTCLEYGHTGSAWCFTRPSQGHT